MGGMTAILAAVQWFYNRRWQKRKGNAEAALTEITNLKATLEALEKREALYDTWLEQKNDRISELEKEGEERAKAASDKLDAMNAKLDTLAHQNAEQSAEISHLRADNKCLRSQVEDVKKSLDKWRCWKAKTCPDREPPNKGQEKPPKETKGKKEAKVLSSSVQPLLEAAPQPEPETMQNPKE